VLVGAGAAQAVTLQQATRTIPIVFVMSGAPVHEGIVDGLLNLPPPANMALRIQHLGAALSVPNLCGDGSDDPLNFGRQIDSPVNADFHLENVHMRLCSLSNHLPQVRTPSTALVV
jgi:hypothetical protein